jgi:hypothetical protein
MELAEAVAVGRTPAGQIERNAADKKQEEKQRAPCAHPSRGSRQKRQGNRHLGKGQEQAERRGQRGGQTKVAHGLARAGEISQFGDPRHEQDPCENKTHE